MTTVSFLGGGRIVKTVATLSVAAGHRVVLGDSRGPEAAADLVAELGPLASPATGEQAAESGDIVLVRTPLGAYPHVPPRRWPGRSSSTGATTIRGATARSSTWTPVGSPAVSCCSGTCTGHKW